MPENYLYIPHTFPIDLLCIPCTVTPDIRSDRHEQLSQILENTERLSAVARPAGSFVRRSARLVRSFGAGAMINYFFMLQHRRLRAQFRMVTLERHADRLLRAIEARRSASQVRRAA